MDHRGDVRVFQSRSHLQRWIFSIIQTPVQSHCRYYHIQFMFLPLPF